MRGETTASPRATVRMAAMSSAGGTSLSRNPLAPARSALKAYSSRSKVVRMRTRVSVARHGRRDGPGGLDPVEDGHAHVHEHDVGPVELDQAHGVGAVGGLADDLEVVLGLEDHAEPLAQQRLVVGQDDPDRHAVVGRLAVAQRGHDLPATRRPGAGLERAPEGGGPLRHPGHAVAAAGRPVPLPLPLVPLPLVPWRRRAPACARRR